jgi:transposase
MPDMLKLPFHSSSTKPIANDAAGLAQLVRLGWYRAVEVKSLESHALRVVLRVRAQLIAMRTTLSNQIRGLLKTFGVVLAPGRGQRFQQLVEARLPHVSPIRLVITSLLTLWQQVGEELKQFDREIDRQARASAVCRRLMSVPGVGSITAVAYVAMVDNPCAVYALGRCRRVSRVDPETLSIWCCRSAGVEFKMWR